MNKSLLPPGVPGTVPRAFTPSGGGICFISQKRKVKFLNRPASPPAPTPPQHVLFLGEAVNGGISSTAMDYRWGTLLGYLLFWGHPQLQLSPGRENQLLQPSYLCISTSWFHLGKLACEMHHFIFPRTPTTSSFTHPFTQQIFVESLYRTGAVLGSESWGLGGRSLLLHESESSLGIFPTQGSNPGLPPCKRILYQLNHQGSPRILELVAYPFSKGTSQPRNRTGVSCIAGRFFIN